MGILNITPDSFSDGGCFFVPEKAIEQALLMVADGAAILDIGGESTRPGAEAVSAQQELDRVIPVIESLIQEIEVPISIDTSKPEVMRAAVSSGAAMVNDVKALSEPGAMSVVAELDIPVCLMHMQGEPRTMQQSPEYPGGVVSDINDFFDQRISAAETAGIKRANICIDPGFGFGKTLKHNYEILNQLDAFQIHGLPILVGISRKSMIGNLLNIETAERLSGSLAAAVIAAMKGAAIFRVHDVRETVQALEIFRAFMHPELMPQ